MMEEKDKSQVRKWAGNKAFRRLNQSMGKCVSFNSFLTSFRGSRFRAMFLHKFIPSRRLKSVTAAASLFTDCVIVFCTPMMNDQKVHFFVSIKKRVKNSVLLNLREKILKYFSCVLYFGCNFLILFVLFLSWKSCWREKSFRFLPIAMCIMNGNVSLAKG